MTLPCRQMRVKARENRQSTRRLTWRGGWSSPLGLSRRRLRLRARTCTARAGADDSPRLQWTAMCLPCPRCQMRRSRRNPSRALSTAARHPSCPKDHPWCGLACRAAAPRWRNWVTLTHAARRNRADIQRRALRSNTARRRLSDDDSPAPCDALAAKSRKSASTPWCCCGAGVGNCCAQAQ